MSHQEENQTLPHIQPMQHIPEPLPALTHSVEQYIKWLTGNSSEQTSNSSEQHKKLEPPTIRRQDANDLIYERPCDSSEQPSNSSEQPTIRREHANDPITDKVILYLGMWSLE